MGWQEGSDGDGDGDCGGEHYERWWCQAPCAENDKINVLDEPYFEQLSSLSNLRDPREEHSATYFYKRPGF